MYACLAVTCHLHFWQNDRDFLRATVVTRGWNGYRNKSQHRKSTLEKKILPPFQQGFEPATFQSRVRCSNHWAIPAPALHVIWLLLLQQHGWVKQQTERINAGVARWFLHQKCYFLAFIFVSLWSTLDQWKEKWCFLMKEMSTKGHMHCIVLHKYWICWCHMHFSFITVTTQNDWWLLHHLTLLYVAVALHSCLSWGDPVWLTGH